DFAAGTNNANFNTTITLPIAKNANGTAITGPAFEYIVSPGNAYKLNYAAATLNQSQARLTHRIHLDDAPVTVPPAAGGGRRVEVRCGGDPDQAGERRRHGGPFHGERYL